MTTHFIEICTETSAGRIKTSSVSFVSLGSLQSSSCTENLVVETHNKIFYN